MIRVNDPHPCASPPHRVPLSPGGAAGDFVRWIEEECDPSDPPHSVAGGFTHFSTEWDWLSFLWNLYVNDDNPYTVAEIADVWDGVPTGDVAYYCCHLDANDDPDNCARYPGSGVCGVGTPTMRTVGKLWTVDATFGVNVGLAEEVGDIYNDWGEPLYNPDKFDLFVNTGTFTRVNF
jgi:hypothetical protein